MPTALSGLFGLCAVAAQGGDVPSQAYLGDFVFPPRLQVPADLGTWAAQRDGIRRTLWDLLGDLPPRPDRLEVSVVRREQRDGYTLESITFDNGTGAVVPGYVVVPDGLNGAAPAILYHHYHGGQYDLGKDEILKVWPCDTTPAEAFARRGWVVLAIDSYAFGERRRQGPAGDREEGRDVEWSLFKMFAWEGRTLWGMMVRDDQIALDYLCSRPEVDPARVGSMGMSMGSTRTWWLAALDDRVKVSVCVACLTRYEELIRHGLLSAHGFYYYVPGVLRHFDAEAIVALIAPRPLLTLTGDSDGTSPADGAEIINATCREVYALYGQEECFRGLVYENLGHAYTEEMWRETLEWFDRWL